ncbi:MAG: cyclomaltodextrinase C-terminal domain-containing protein [Balneolaceae bacterium]|nr:cyclomaltodextrinase C-terminal domain-containing protein [Balneolaceae bacterium]
MDFEKESTHPVTGAERPEDENKFDEDLFKWYKKLGQIRNEHELLRTGEYKKIKSKDDLFVFARHKEKKNPIIVLLNRADKERKIDLELSKFITTPDKYRDLLSGKEMPVSLKNTITINLEAVSGAVLVPQ